MKLRLHDNGGQTAEFDTETGRFDDNIWIERIREDGSTTDYVGSLYFEKRADGSVKLSLGASDCFGSDWEVLEEITIPAREGNSTWPGMLTE